MAVSYGMSKERDLAALKPLINTLSRRYPADFYERMGPEIVVFLAFATASALVQAFDEKAQAVQHLIAIVLVAASLTFALVPPVLYRRLVGVPRWAHRLAEVEPFEAQQVKEVTARVFDTFDQKDLAQEVREDRMTGMHVYMAAVALSDNRAQFRRKKRSRS